MKIGEEDVNIERERLTRQQAFKADVGSAAAKAW